MKQQLTEALASLNDSHSYLVPNDLAEQGYEAWLEVIAAARLVERLLPGECGSCPPMNHQLPPNERPFCICATCHGSGQVWDEGIVELVALELSKYQGSTEDMFLIQARAVLSAIAQLTEAGSQ